MNRGFCRGGCVAFLQSFLTLLYIFSYKVSPSSIAFSRRGILEDVSSRGDTIENFARFDEHRIKCINDLRNEYRRIVGKYLANRPAVLVDIVEHWNLGDSFIQVGEMIFMKENGTPAKLPCSWHSCDYKSLSEELNSGNKDGVILIHGGGNIGDLWRSHALFKNLILKLFPLRQIIALPQTIDYRNEKLALMDAKEFHRHNNFTILVRDNPSLNYAEKVLKVPTELCPDGAFMIGPIDPSRYKNCKLQYDVIIIARTDHESRSSGNKGMMQAKHYMDTNKISYVHTDWFSWMKLIGPKDLPEDPLSHADLRLQVAVEMLCKGKLVLTDRLHATILSTLMGKPHVFVDTLFGKIGRFRGTFFSTRPDCSDEYLRAKKVVSWIEAARAAKRFLFLNKY